MRSQGFRLGQIAAIPIRLHWSWILILALLIISFRPVYAQYACGSLNPCGVDIAISALMAVLLTCSILLHELGHALTAKFFTIPVQGITLFALGGVATFDIDSPTPGTEFAIAVAGPAMSLLIALVGGLIWWLGFTLPLGIVSILASHIGLVNLILTLFNLLPGYPMDGGRVLRAVLWFLNDEQLPATRLAAQLGRACGFFIGIGGALLALRINNPALVLWTAVIGTFIYRTSTASHRQLTLQTVLHNVRVSDLMQRRFRTVDANLTIEQFVSRYVLGQAETGFAVVDDTAPQPDGSPVLLGMITLRHVRKLTTAQWSSHQVHELMTPFGQVRPLDPQTSALEALYLLNDNNDALLPVTEGQNLIGLLRRHDLALYIQVQLTRRRA